MFHWPGYYGDPFCVLDEPSHYGRFDYYPVPYIPTLRVDGVLEIWPIDQSSQQIALSSRMWLDSPIMIDIDASATDNSIDATITLTSGDEAVNGNYKLRIGLASRDYYGWTGNNGQSEWHHDMLIMYPDHNGTAVSLGANDTYELDATFDWPLSVNNDPMTVDNMVIVAYVQNDDTFEVIQSNMADVSEGQPVTLTITPQTTDIPVGGGTVVYDASFVNTTAMTGNGLRYRTYVTLPNGTRVGPTMNTPFNMTAYMDVTVSGLTQDVPSYAPAGTYSFHATAGVPQNPDLMVMDSFEFTKAGTVGDGTFTFDPDDWAASGFEIAGDAAQTEQLPRDYAVGAAFPNPFNPETTVNVSLPETAELSVVVYNVAGQQVATLHNGRITAGTHALSFEASSLSSGLYFVRATVPGQLDQTQKVMLVR